MSDYHPVELGYMPDALLMYCSDGRFFDAHESSAETHGVKSEDRLPDRIVIPGPSYSIVEESSGRVILPYIRGLLKLHGCTQISIYDHFPCGWMTENTEGYRESDEAGKIAIHGRHLKAAEEILSQSFKGIDIQTHLFGPKEEIDLSRLAA